MHLLRVHPLRLPPALLLLARVPASATALPIARALASAAAAARARTALRLSGRSEANVAALHEGRRTLPLRELPVAVDGNDAVVANRDDRSGAGLTSSGLRCGLGKAFPGSLILNAQLSL